MLITKVNTKLSEGGKGIHRTETEELENIIKKIRTDEDMKGLINSYRELKREVDKEIEDGATEQRKKVLKEILDSNKRELPYVVFGVTYNVNNQIEKSYVDTFTGIISIDFDHLDDKIDYYRGILESDKYTHFLFTSPSGTGLKGGIKYVKPHKMSIEDQTIFFETQLFPELEIYYKENYGLTLDKQCKNINRLTFLSYDENINYKGKSEEYLLKPKITEIKSVKKNNPLVIQNAKVSVNGDLLEKIYNGLVNNNVNLETFLSSIITNGGRYNNWLSFGWMLCVVYMGRENEIKNTFHKFSSLDNDYDFGVCDKQIDALIKSLDTSKKNYKLLYHQLILWSERNIGVVITADERKELKQEPNFIIDFVKDNIVVKYDEIESEYYITFKFVDNSISCDFVNERVNDDVYNTILIILQLLFPSLHSVSQLRTYLCNTNAIRYNKIVDLLESLKTDDPTNLQFMIDYLKVKESDEVKNMYFKNWMIGVFSNLLLETKCNMFFILKGDSGFGKTMFFNEVFLKLFRDLRVISQQFTFSTESKDELEKLTSMMFIYDDDIHATTKADIQAIKKITSMTSVNQRRSYDITKTYKPRISSFCASANPKEIFNDPTSSIRFCVLEVDKGNKRVEGSEDYIKYGSGWENQIEHEYVEKTFTKEFMGKVWGFMYNEFLKGERWNKGKYKLNYELHAEIAEQSRVITTDEEVFRTCLVPYKDLPMTLPDIIEGIHNLYPSIHLNTGYANRNIGLILKKIGIESKKTNRGVRYLCRINNLQSVEDIIKEDPELKVIFPEDEEKPFNPSTELNSLEQRINDKLKGKL